MAKKRRKKTKENKVFVKTKKTKDFTAFWLSQ